VFDLLSLASHSDPGVVWELVVAFNSPSVPWSEVERIASGRAPVLGDGSDSPAWSRKREGYAGAPADLRDRRSRDDGGDRLRAPYAELHVHSNFSFLDGASHPETLVEEAARLELDALVLTDHDGMYGAWPWVVSDFLVLTEVPGARPRRPRRPSRQALRSETRPT
jgi:hypothetical protein